MSEPQPSEDEALLSAYFRGELDDTESARVDARLAEDSDFRRLGERALTGGTYSEATTTAPPDWPDLAATRVTTTGGTSVNRFFPTSEIQLAEVIGEGGMGVVHRGVQASVGREVAIKTVVRPQDAGALLQEAYITGQLEHPNVMPIHDIVIETSGRPLVVLKHIEGRVWRETVSKPADMAIGAEGEGSIEWHVKVLIQVCQALRFAHSRGIVHRDIKPSNIMIGTFDEVYLMDWGVAMALDSNNERLKNIGTSPSLAGSPAYMAPEQFEGDPAKIGAHTDVYLVGASLYHAIVGKPPQAGRDLEKLQQAIHERTEVSLPDGTPSELRAIVNRAMNVEVSKRYRSIAELRHALERFLQHRSSKQLVESAALHTEQMAEAQWNEDEATAERAFFDAAFCYRAALEAWPGNTSARTQLRELVRQRVVQLLAEKAPTSANRALKLTEDPAPELVQRVEAALEADALSKARLDEFELGDNREFGLEVRRVGGAVFGASWVVLWAWVGWFKPESARPILAATLVYFGLAVIYFYRTRKVMWEVRLNRYNAGIICVGLLAQTITVSVTTIIGAPVTPMLTQLLLIWALTAACSAVVVDMRISPTAVVYALGFVICAADPAQLTWVLPTGALVTVLTSLGINFLTARQARAQRRAARK